MRFFSVNLLWSSDSVNVGRKTKGSPIFKIVIRLCKLQHIVKGPVLVDRARPLSCPGWDLDGVKLLQSHDDAKEIHASSQGRRVVVVGASFIG